MKQLTLPNGMDISYIDKITALYVYNEIFEERVYLQRGLKVTDGDVIFDVGGNIGLFSKFIANHAENLKVYAFEPLFPIFEVFQENMKDEDCELHAFNVGLGMKRGRFDVIYYEKITGDSTAVPWDWDRKVDLYVENYNEAIAASMPIAKLVPKCLRKWVVERSLKRMYSGKKITCKLRTMSGIIDQYDVERIHLLKIDAENYEKQVLAGLRDDHWDRIQQIAMEVHTHIPGGENLMEEMIQLLESKGFTVEEGDESRETIMGVYMLYAKR